MKHVFEPFNQSGGMLDGPRHTEDAATCWCQTRTAEQEQERRERAQEEESRIWGLYK